MSDTLHIAIIPDGNRRWAKQNGLKGYKNLYDVAINRLVDVTEVAFDSGVTHLSMWGSSHANLADRSSDFFNGIDKSFRDNIHRFSEHPVIEKYGVRINIIGEWRDSLTPKTIEAFEEAMAKTAHHSNRELTLLIDYSGTRERTSATQAILDNPTTSEPVEQLLRSRSWTGHLPDADLIIRTGSWQDPHNSAGFFTFISDESQYAFPEIYWPDFSPGHFHGILNDFLARDRRHGK
jgi:undecaprenyl diphosphate synthase